MSERSGIQFGFLCAWPDDGRIRIAVYDGRKLLEQSASDIVEGANVIDVRFHGHPFNISGVCKIVCTKNTNE